MDHTDESFHELMKNYQSEVPGLEAQISADLAEARKRASGGSRPASSLKGEPCCRPVCRCQRTSVTTTVE